jgi:hypothetical protein
VGRNQLDFFAELHTMSENSRLIAGFAGTALAGGSVDAATVLAKRTRAHVPLGTSQSLAINRIHNHRAPEKTKAACVGSSTPVPQMRNHQSGL